MMTNYQWLKTLTKEQLAEWFCECGLLGNKYIYGYWLEYFTIRRFNKFKKSKDIDIAKFLWQKNILPRGIEKYYTGNHISIFSYYYWLNEKQGEDKTLDWVCERCQLRDHEVECDGCINFEKDEDKNE